MRGDLSWHVWSSWKKPRKFIWPMRSATVGTTLTESSTFATMNVWTARQRQSLDEVHHGCQDPSNPDARKSTDHPSEQSVKYRETSCSHFNDTRRKHLEEVSEVSTGKPVAVTLITEIKVSLTQPSKKKTRIVRTSYKDWFNTSRITRSGTR